MILSVIAAMDQNRLIGVNNALPWHLPADLQYFKRVTMGKPILMGRKTYESIGRPLPGRTNLVITRDAEWYADGVVVVHSLEEAKRAVNEHEIVVIGGATFYAQVLNEAQRLYLTRVHSVFEGDAWFPDYDETEWELIEREDHDADEKNPHNYSFMTYERKTHQE